METRICQNCKENFIIEPDDFAFYEKIKVPAPTFCPDCRQQRRYAWRNESTLYRRNCDLCKKSIVTIYHPSALYVVYCSTCWWSDSWDSKSFAQDIDFSRPFFDQFKELQSKVPRMAVLTKNSVDSEYTNHAENNKKCYLCFDVFSSENTMYSFDVWNGAKDSCDCTMIVDRGSLMYECTSCDRGYNCQFCLQVHDSINCNYCFDCRNCSDCFLSYNLRNKKYCILNEQYSKEEYDKKMSEYNFGSGETRLDLYNQWIDLIKNKAIHKFAQIEKSVDVSGDVIGNSKNCHNVFDTFDSTNVKHSVIAGAKDAMDLYSVGLGVSELLYESHALLNSSNVSFTHLSYDNTFIQYCDTCHNSQNLFGCVGMKKGKYCILNKEYTKEEYENVKENLINHMKSSGEYGEFFPANLSPFGYNETHGEIFMPLTKNEAIEKGFNWQDDLTFTKGKETIKAESIPDNITDINDQFIKEVYACTNCERNYNIIPEELEFYRNHIIPIPRHCYNCRHKRRVSLRPERKLYNRSCTCDKSGHTHEGKCEVEFETSYAPERPEIIYCEKCYQQEVL